MDAIILNIKENKMAEEKRAIKVKFPEFDINTENPYQEEMDKLIDIDITEATTTRTLKNVTEALTKALKSKYGITDKEELKQKTNEILKLHGLSTENFDPISFISKQVFGNIKTVNDVSIDDNANKTDTNMTGVCVESFLPYQKLAGYDFLYRTIAELYGKNEAKKCTADMYDFSLALNDSTKILLPYCYCVDASKIVTEGRNFGQVHSSPAHRISTYISVLGDTIREMSFNVAGALAVGTLFMDVCHLAVYRERITLDDLKNDKKTRKAMSNHFQQFIHTVNHYSRNAVESPFTNVSCFDRDKLRGLIDDDNYGWYFPKKAAIVEDNNLEDSKEAYKEFILDYIEELQEIYLDVFDEGDPLRGGLQFPFPVTTINLSTTTDENGKRHLSSDNNALLNYITKKDVSRYNIYSSEGSKVASCCLAATTPVLCKVDGFIKYVTVQQLYNIWNVSNKIKNIEIMGPNGFVKVVNGFKIPNETSVLQKVTLKGGLVISTTLNHPSVKIEDRKLVELRADELREGDFIPVSKNISYVSSLGGSRNLGRFVGLFCAEGQYDQRKDTCIAMSFHTNEVDLQDFVMNFAKENFGATTSKQESIIWPNATRIGINSKAVHGLMRDFLHGDLCTTKRVSSKLFNMSEDFRLGFLEGFVEGDGHTCDSSRSDYGAIHIANKDLGMDLLAVANSLNIKCSYRNGSNGNDCVVNFLGNNKVKLKPLQDWHGGEGDKRESTILNDFGNFYGVKIEKIEQIKTRSGSFVYDFEVCSEDHLFQIANGIITHNCRLLSDSDFLAYAGGVNSFGGSQVSLGSHRVVTINFARCAYEADSYDDFKAIVSQRIDSMAKILKAHKVLILKLEQLGKQPWISNGWIDMTHMFSTFGCIGYVEAAEILTKKFNHKDFDYMKDFLVYFNNECKKAADKENIIFNIEAIPGESMAPKLAKADSIICNGEYKIYANQWTSLWEDNSIYQKMKRDGEINSLMTGGSIVHISVDSKLTQSQAKKLITEAVNEGMEHFALNCYYTECADCGKVEKGNFEKCIHCGSEKTRHYSRIIGYFVQVENANKTRREVDFPNRKFVTAEMIKEELGN